MPDIFSEILRFIGGVAAVGAATTACAFYNMSPDRLDEFLDGGPLTPVQKAELKAESDKTKYYSHVKRLHDLDKASDASEGFHAKFAKNGIFIPDPLKSKFAAIDNILKEAIIERQVQPHEFDKGVALHDKARAVLAELGRDIQSRRWSSQESGI